MISASSTTKYDRAVVHLLLVQEPRRSLPHKFPVSRTSMQHLHLRLQRWHQIYILLSCRFSRLLRTVLIRMRLARGTPTWTPSPQIMAKQLGTSSRVSTADPTSERNLSRDNKFARSVRVPWHSDRSDLDRREECASLGSILRLREMIQCTPTTCMVVKHSIQRVSRRRSTLKGTILLLHHRIQFTPGCEMCAVRRLLQCDPRSV
jgi:hypothetical protein